MMVELALDGAVATITLRDERTRNALDDEALVAIRAALDSLRARSDVSVVVLRGAGDSFCSGGSMTAVSSLAQQGRTAAGRRTLAARVRENSALIERMLAQPQLTVALVTGPAVGAGLGIAGACDFRYALETAVFVPGFDRLGLTTDLGTTAVLRRILGDCVANAWLLRGEPWSAAVALHAGLVTEVLPESGLEALFARLSDAVQPGSGARIAAQRSLSFDSATLSAELDHEAELFAQAIATDYAQQAIGALQRRPARERGR